jgi:hypothetical protein
MPRPLRAAAIRAIRDKAMAITSAKAKGADMIAWATDNPAADGAAAGAVARRDAPRRGETREKLVDIGVRKSQSSRGQKLGALDDEAFAAGTAVAKRHGRR